MKATANVVWLPARRKNVRRTDAIERERRIRFRDGRTIAYVELGDSAGRPVFYFHGYPGSRLEGRLAEAAAERLGLRLIAPDRPGFGESTFQPDRTIGSWVADVVALADQLALERFGIVGVSGGGPYALACAARIPERLTEVALVCPLGPLEHPAATAGMIPLNRFALAAASRAPRLARGVIRVAAQWIRRDPESYLKNMMAHAPIADRSVFADPAYRAVFARSMAEALRQGGRGVAWELTLLARPWNFKLQEVRMNVRLWQGLADNIVPPAMARQLAAALPRAEARYLPDEGHLSLIVRHLDAILADLVYE